MFDVVVRYCDFGLFEGEEELGKGWGLRDFVH